MGIFNLIFNNTGNKARTLKPSAISLPKDFRGALKHDTPTCIGCRTCAYVCSPGAITLDENPDGVLWQYQAIRCTFCARCEEYCPTGAIHLEALAPGEQPSVLGTDRITLTTQHQIEFRACERCGEPFLPLPAPVMARLTGHEVEADLASLMRLCEKCRRRVTSQRFKDSLTGQLTAHQSSAGYQKSGR